VARGCCASGEWVKLTEFSWALEERKKKPKEKVLPNILETWFDSKLSSKFVNIKV
jgi:hypothetical protein